MTIDARDSTAADMGMWKAWVVLCVAQASRLGLAPLAMSQLHVLLYLANTLAPLFNVLQVRGRVLKRGPYPFYPDVQHEIDRLAFSGFLSIQRVDFGAKGNLTAHYDAGPKARHLCHSMLSASPEARRTANLFTELAAACFGKFLAVHTAIGSVDANYGSTDVVENEVVDFAEWQDENKNMDVALYLISALRKMQPQADRDGVRLYCDYIDKALAET